MKNIISCIKNHITIDKPKALQCHEWEEWEMHMQKTRPFAFWLNETVPDFLDDVKHTITKPFKEASYWVRYRTWDKYHLIPTGLDPGYYEVDTLIIHGMFQLLVDFVEIEKAWMHVVWSKDNRVTYKVPWYCQGFFKIKQWRCRDAGLAYLDWECTLGSLPVEERAESQASAAYEIIELYKWWTEERPNRPDPHDASGWSEYCDKRRDAGISLFDTRHETVEDGNESRRLLDLTCKIEQEQHNEDQENLIRLINIRRSLWT